jgi:ABC-2 type transport system permease protein
MSQVDALFKSRRARAVMIIPADFDRRLSVDTYVPVQFLFDASDANAATVVRNYCLQILMSYNDSRGVKVSLPFDLRSTVLFNPGLQSSYFFVPGIIAMILVMISALLTSVTISREKETGTMEQILVSPVRPYEIVVGKVFPYVGLAFLSGGSTLFLGFALFHVPFRGNPLVLVGLTSLYVLCGVSLGLMISTVVRTQQVAMIAANFSTMLPTMLLSGLVFHLASIPRALQILSYLVPARYYLLIVRGIILKGSGLQALVYPTLSLALLSLVMLAISVRRFSMTLEK